MKKIILLSICVVLIMFLVLASIKLVQNNERERRIEETRIDTQQRRESYSKDCHLLKEIMQKAVIVSIKEIRNNRIVFIVNNNTKGDIKYLRAKFVLKNVFGDILDYNSQTVTYEAISMQEVIRSNRGAEITYDLAPITKQLSFNIYQYGNNIKADFEISHFSLTNGDEFDESPSGPQGDPEFLREKLEGYLLK